MESEGGGGGAANESSESQPAHESGRPVLQRRRSPRIQGLEAIHSQQLPLRRTRAISRQIIAKKTEARAQNRAEPAHGGPHDKSYTPDDNDGDVDMAIEPDDADGDDLEATQLAGSSADDSEEESVLEADESEDDDGNEAASVVSGGKAASAASSKGNGDIHGRNMDRVCMVEVCKRRVPVPAPQPVHESWSAWKEYLQAYMTATHQVIVTHTTLNVKGRNRQIDKLVRKQPHVPLDLEVFSRNYICTHGWPDKVRGTGKRNKRFVRGIGCPFKFRVQAAESNGKWVLVVHNGCMWHNHRLDAETYATYPVARMGLSEDSCAQARSMADLGVPRAQVYDMLLDRGENVFQNDVDNIVAKHRGRINVQDDDEATVKVLVDFSATNDGGLITIDETEAGETGVISITTRHMREMCERFGELVLVDCTHKTNKYNYQLCTMMVMDEFGLGKVVQQSLFERNADWHMERALDHFVAANEGALDDVKVIIVDKDLNEIKVLQARFPNARVLICTFHVIKYLGTAVHKAEFGKLSKDDYDALEALISNIVYSKSELIYNENLLAIKTFCSQANFEGFYKYFEKNWHHCSEMWVMYKRDDLPHLQNNTNNRLENFFGKFKKGVGPTSTMAECIQHLLNNARRSARQTQFNERVGRNFNSNYDEEMNNVLMCTTHFVAERVFPQYAHALENFANYTYSFPHGPEGQIVVVSSKNESYEVDLSDYSCVCDFAKTMRLPCRHAMAYRKHVGGCAVIPIQQIGPRWQHLTRKLKPTKRFAIRDYRGSNRVDQGSLLGNGIVRTQANSPGYKEAKRLLQPILTELGEIEDVQQLNKYCDFFLQYWRAIRQRSLEAIAWSGDSIGGIRVDAVGDLTFEKLRDVDTDIDLSQTHCLVSGECAQPDTNPFAAKMPKHGHEMENNVHNMDASAFLEHDKETSEETKENASSAQEESENGDNSTASFKIKLNPRAPKHGAPKVDLKKQASVAAAIHIQFNQATAVAQARGATNLRSLMDSFRTKQTNLYDVLIALKSVPEKHRDHKTANKKPVLETATNPVLTTADLFLLPDDLIQLCLKKLPADTSAENPIAVYTPTGTPPPKPPQKPGPVQVIRINKVGIFSADQIRMMHSAINLREACLQGERFLEWVEEEAPKTIPVGQLPQVLELLATLRASYPYAQIPGVSNSSISMLYNIQPPSWFCGGVIRVFCTRLQTYDGVFDAGVFSPDEGKKVAGKKDRPSEETRLRQRVGQLLCEDNVHKILVTVNFSNSHWAALTVDARERDIAIYDSLGITKRFEKMAQTLATTLQFGVTALNAPIQPDSHSCGLFVCYKFWSQVDSTVPRNMSEHSLTRRRLELAHFIYTGDKLE